METGENKPNKGPEKKVEGQSNDQLIELVKQMQQKIADMEKAQTMTPDAIASMLAKFQAEKKNHEGIDYQKGVTAEQVPIDDYLEKPVTFSAPSVGMCIVDDVRKGIRVILPYGKQAIMFLHTATRHVKRDKYTELVTMCSYTSRSKAEVEWLRNHSLYNVVFYETTKGVIGAEIQNATRVARLLSGLNQMDMPSVVKRTKEYNLPITDDVNTMRAALAVKMAQVETESEQTASHKRLTEIEEEKRKILENK